MPAEQTELAVGIAKVHQDAADVAICPRWTGRAYVAVVTVHAGGDATPVLVEKVDLSKSDRRAEFATKVVGALPAVKAEEIEKQLCRLCGERSESLKKMDEIAAEKEDNPTLADMMVEIAFEECELAHDDNNVAYARVEVDGHCETWPVRSRGFRLWLRRRLREEQERSAHAEAVQSAIEEVEGKALFEGKQVAVFVRLAACDGTIYLDLADENWRTIQVTASGWMLVEGRSPVWFIRSRGMLALPVPERGGSIDDLRPFLNVRDSADFVLLVSWLLAALCPWGPFPILNVCGEQGSAKSTMQRLLRLLVDPNAAPLRSEPREPRDLVISASNSWVIAFDNLSNISPWLSDAFCRLSTGGGFATRELYTDADECIFDAKRPLMFNGIEDVASRPDLLDRCISIALMAIPPANRKDEKTLLAEFEAVRPRILGALLNAVASGLANRDRVFIDPADRPRMMDFALWVTACECGTNWSPRTFITAYTKNRQGANETAIEASIVGQTVQAFMADRPTWQGTPAELLSALEAITDEKVLKRRDWPGTARKLTGDLTRIAPNLRQAGIQCTRSPRTGKARPVVLERISGDDKVANGDGSDGAVTQPPQEPEADNFSEDLAFRQGGDDGDGSDGIPPSLSESPIELDETAMERAAIAEFDGGLSRDRAEEVARGEAGKQDTSSIVADETDFT